MRCRRRVIVTVRSSFYVANACPAEKNRSPQSNPGQPTQTEHEAAHTRACKYVPILRLVWTLWGWLFDRVSGGDVTATAFLTAFSCPFSSRPFWLARLHAL